MPRRSRTKGASGAGKTKRPPVAPPEAHREFEAKLDEIFDAMMSRDGEWLKRIMAELMVVPSFAPDVITRRMIEGRERAPGIVLAILSDIAQERTPVYLQRIAKARDAPDNVRFEAQRMLGWEPMREDKRRVGFLKSLRDPFGTLASSTNAVGSIWPAQVEALHEIEAYLWALEPPARYEALDRIIDEAGWNAIPLLHGLLHGNDPVAQIRVIDALAAFRFSASPGPLRRLASTSDSDEVRGRVEDVLSDVTFDRDQSPDDSNESFPRHGLYPFAWARVTRVDPDGRQSLWVTREIGEGIYESTNIYVNGPDGIEEINRIDRLPLDMLEDDIQAIEGTIAPTTDIELAAARGIVSTAAERFVAAGRVFPFEFEIYEPLLHDTYPPSPDEAVVVPVLDDAGFADRADLRERGAELLVHPLFNEWALDFEHVLATIGRNLPSDPDEIGGASGDTRFDALPIQLLDAGIRLQVCDALRRQAWLLDQRGSSDERDIALALAAWLPVAGDDELAGNGFVTGLAQVSLGVSSMLASMNEMLGDFEGLDDDWLADTDLDDGWDELNAGDGAIEADWTIVPEQDEASPPNR